MIGKIDQKSLACHFLSELPSPAISIVADVLVGNCMIACVVAIVRNLATLELLAILRVKIADCIDNTDASMTQRVQGISFCGLH